MSAGPGPPPRGVLQVGCGGFGPVHIQAWYALGLGPVLHVADPDPAARERALALNLPPERVVADFREALERVEVVDVVAATDRHAELCLAALEAGRDVFVEKPMTRTTAEAQSLAEAVRASGRVLQVGYYFRHHPLARRAKAWLEAGELGELRYLSGTFAGFKRARRDIGVTQSDAVHFIDLFNWFTGSLPVEVFAVTRDHFGRGLEDLSLVLLTYPDGGALAKVESGYVQPGRRPDTVMPNALTTKEVAVSGAEGAFAIDFQADRATLHRTRFELVDGTWTPRLGEAVTPHVEPATPVQVVAAELRAFLRCVATGERPEANVEDCGVAMARILDAVHRSARERRPVAPETDWARAAPRLPFG